MHHALASQTQSTDDLTLGGHTPRPACPRCGTFAPLDAIYGVCPTCVALLLPEGARGAPGLVGIWRGVGHVLAVDGVRIAAFALATATPCALMLAFLPRETSEIIERLWGLVTLFASIVVMLLGRAALLRRSLTLADAMTDGIAAYPRVFWAVLVAGVYTVLWGLVLLIPGVYMRERYTLAGPTALFSELRGDAAVTRSSERMLGRVRLGFGNTLIVVALWVGGLLPILFGVASIPGLAEDEVVRVGVALTSWVGASVSALGALANVVLYEQVVVFERANEHRLGAPQTLPSNRAPATLGNGARTSEIVAR